MKKLIPKNSIQLVIFGILFAMILLSPADIYAAGKPKSARLNNKNNSVIANQIRDEADEYFDQNQYEKAIPLYLKLIAVIEKANILVGPGLANDYSSLAYSYRLTKQYKKAETYFLKAIAADENELVIEHPTLIFHYGNLGLLYVDMNKNDEAEDYLLKSLREKYGSAGNERSDMSHAYMSIIYENLADIYAHKKEFAKAETNYELAAESGKKVESFENIGFERLYKKIADMRVEQGLFDSAAMKYENFLIPIQEELWSESDDRVIRSYSSLANLLKIEKQYEKAEALNLKAIAILEKKYGTDHASLAQSYSQLASVYVELGLYNKAESYYLNAIRLAKKNYQPDDPAFATWNYLLAGVYAEQGLYEKAEALYLKAIADQEKLLGDNEPDLAWTYTQLAFVYQAKKNYSQAEPLFQKAVSITLNNLGNTNKNTKIATENYVHCLEIQGKATKELRMKYGLPLK